MDFKREAAFYGEYDVVVAGGGPAGIGAGIAAARGGLKTILLEANGCMGGTSTSGNLPFYLGAYNGSVPYRTMLAKGLQYKDLPRPRRAVRGIFEQMMQKMRDMDGGVGPAVMGQTEKYPILDRFGCHDEFTFDLEKGKLAYDQMAKEVGLDVLYYTTAMDTEVVDNEVKGVYIFNKSGLQFIKCKAVIDCTGDADLVARSGYETYKGDKETGEMTAMSIVAHIENIDAGKIAEYLEQGGDPWFLKQCQQAAKTPEGNGNEAPLNLVIFPMVQEGVFMVNGGTAHAFVGDRNLDGTNGDDLTELTFIGRQRAQWLVEKLFRPYIPGAENCRLRSTATYPGIRETRRIVAEKTLTEEDAVKGTKFPDTIALAGRHFDLTRKGVEESEKDGGLQEFAGKNALGGGIAAIPYGALIPKGSKNIIVAGRCIAADGQALGPARIMSTCMAVGEAAGTAAVFKLRDGVDFKDVNIDELRATLKANGAEIDA